MHISGLSVKKSSQHLLTVAYTIFPHTKLFPDHHPAQKGHKAHMPYTVTYS